MANPEITAPMRKMSEHIAQHKPPHS